MLIIVGCDAAGHGFSPVGSRPRGRLNSHLKNTCCSFGSEKYAITAGLGCPTVIPFPTHVNSKIRMAAIIQAENVAKVYRIGKVDVPALRGVSLSVERGEFVSIVGPSGSGKSTLFYILGGLTGPSSGRVIIEGADFSQLSDAERTRLRRRRIGFVFQKFNLLPTLDAAGNIAIAHDIAGGNGKLDYAYLQKITEMLGIAGRLNHRPSEMSGGEQQRVALARALVNKPAIVLADEPTG